MRVGMGWGVDYGVIVFGGLPPVVEVNENVRAVVVLDGGSGYSCDV